MVPRRWAGLACACCCAAVGGAPEPAASPEVAEVGFAASELDGRAVEELALRGHVLIRPDAELVETMRAAEAATAQLFALPASAKARIEEAMRVPAANGSLPRELQLWCTGLRVRPAACSSTYAQAPSRQQHEQFHMVFDRRALALLRWPEDDVPTLRLAVERAGAALESLAESLLALAAPGLLAARAAAVRERGDNSVFDLFRYAGCRQCAGARQGAAEAAADAALRCCDEFGMSSHVDPGIFTCKYVAPGQVEGLQLQELSSGEWLGERQFAGAVCCFVNAALAEWSLSHDDGPPLTAVPHRVVPASEQPRHSVVYEMRTPALEMWDSLADWSKAQRKARRVAAQRERTRQRAAAQGGAS